MFPTSFAIPHLSLSDMFYIVGMNFFNQNNIIKTHTYTLSILCLYACFWGLQSDILTPTKVEILQQDIVHEKMFAFIGNLVLNLLFIMLFQKKKNAIYIFNFSNIYLPCNNFFIALPLT